MPFIIGYFFLIFFCSTNLYAQVPLSTALSLAPPPSDLSLVYLSIIFGTIEGVISSSGSQIFGHMMSVLNLSVMALGSIVIMYTLIVGTLNTAHEGEFLGKHWSSIWLPVRATVGMTLLVPKTSGYCLMQVLVMWVVVQGVGAADKLWASALDYLSMGGSIVKNELDSGKVIADDGTSNPAYNGSAVILAGQVCAYSLQKQLESLRTDYLNQANPSDGSDPTGPCSSGYQVGSLDKTLLEQFCNNSVPDFLSDMNAINVTSKEKTAETWEMPIPYFADNATPDVYKNLSGYCGTVLWKNIQTQSNSNINKATNNLNLNDAQVDSIVYARSIGIQQMIEFLSPVARGMVDNDPQINKNLSSGDGASPSAFSQFGVTLNDNGDVCKSRDSCQNWGAVPNSSASVLLAGTEMFNSINAYQGVMQPVLKLLANPNNSDADFITRAKKDGWFFAGGYYFDMIVLSGSPNNGGIKVDSQSGLDDSKFYPSGSSTCPGNVLCSFLPADDAKDILDKTNNLIEGTAPNQSTGDICTVGLSYRFSKFYVPSKGYVDAAKNDSSFGDIHCSSTTIGYIGNSYFLVTPGAVNASAPLFKMPAIQFFNFKSPHTKGISCKPKIKIIFFTICMGWLFNGFIETVMVGISFILEALMVMVKAMFTLIIYPLLYYFFFQLKNSFLYLTEMSHNPIVNLANMGSSLIETAGNIFLGMWSLSFVIILNPVMGGWLLVFLGLVMPLVLSWVGYFFTIGFFCAYYVPIYPFMIFTFGSIAWLMAVVEAIVAAPIVALGVMSPEGEGILGKSETGMMILVNVFLRPSMMIIGYVVAIMMTYVSVWIVNYQFDHVAGFIINPHGTHEAAVNAGINFDSALFTQIFGYSAYLGIYVSMYITVVQKSFTMIFSLPDKILRWIGAQQEAFGQEIQHWAEESKQKVEQLGQQAEKGLGQADKSEIADDIAKERKGGSGSIGGGGGE